MGRILYALLVWAAIAAAQDGLVAYWRFDEASGAIAIDSAHPGKYVKNVDTDQYYPDYGQYPGTITGAKWTGGQVHLGLEFDGHSKVVTAPIALGTTFSVSAWVKPTAEAVNTPYAYLRIFETAYDQGVYLGTDMSGTKYKLIVNAGYGSSGDCQDAFGCASGGKPIAGKWQLVTGTFDGAFARLYVDGVQVAFDAGTATPRTLTVSIGAYAYYPDAGYDWRGGIDDVRLYNRALTPAEVLVLYNQASNSRIPPIRIEKMACRELNFLGHNTRALTCALKANNKAWRGTIQVKLAPNDAEPELPPLNYAWPVTLETDGTYAVHAVAIYDQAKPRAILGVDFYGTGVSANWTSHTEPRSVLVQSLDTPCPTLEPCASGLYPPPMIVTEMVCEASPVDTTTQAVTCGISANQNTYSGTLRVNFNDGAHDDQRVTVNQPMIGGAITYWGVVAVATDGAQPVESVEFIAESPLANWTPEKTTPYPPVTRKPTTVHGWLCRWFGLHCPK
jgi:hypothetical protein